MKLFSLVVLGLVFLSTNAFSAWKMENNLNNRRHEVLMNISEPALNNYSAGTLSFNNLTRIAVGGAYHYRLNHFIQIGPRLSLMYIGSNGASATVFEILASGRVNFPFDWDFENAFFGDVLFGLGTASAGFGASQTTCLIGFEMGKRFSVFPNVTWQPTFAMTIPTNSGYGSLSLAFRLFTVSVVF